MAEIGKNLGHKVWIARNDHLKDYNFTDSRFGKLKDLTMPGFPFGGLQQPVEKLIAFRAKDEVRLGIGHRA